MKEQSLLQPEHNLSKENIAPQYVDWGLIDYQEALERQLQAVDMVSRGETPEQIIFCTHPAVVTLGRATQEGDVTDWEGELVEVSRGGRATYHGPDQMVVYPIFNLNNRGRDLHVHLRFLEKVVIQVLKSYGLEGYAEAGATGVWVGDKKICSIGIAVKKWTSYHGLSLAVDENPLAYKGINPCGFSSSVMTNLEALVGAPIDRPDLMMRMQSAFKNVSYFSIDNKV